MGFHCQRNPRRHLTTQVIGITACLHEVPFSTRTTYRNIAQNIFTNKMEGSGPLWQRTPNTSQSSPWSLALCCLLHPTDTETQWCKPTIVCIMGNPYQHSPVYLHPPIFYFLFLLSFSYQFFPRFDVSTWKDTFKSAVPGPWEDRKIENERKVWHFSLSLHSEGQEVRGANEFKKKPLAGVPAVKRAPCAVIQCQCCWESHTVSIPISWELLELSWRRQSGFHLGGREKRLIFNIVCDDIITETQFLSFNTFYSATDTKRLTQLVTPVCSSMTIQGIMSKSQAFSAQFSFVLLSFNLLVYFLTAQTSLLCASVHDISGFLQVNTRTNILEANMISGNK